MIAFHWLSHVIPQTRRHSFVNVAQRKSNFTRLHIISVHVPRKISSAPLFHGATLGTGSTKIQNSNASQLTKSTHRTSQNGVLRLALSSQYLPTESGKSSLHRLHLFEFTKHSVEHHQKTLETLFTSISQKSQSTRFQFVDTVNYFILLPETDI